MKDVDRRRDIEDDRENTNGDDRKGSFAIVNYSETLLIRPIKSTWDLPFPLTTSSTPPNRQLSLARV